MILIVIWALVVPYLAGRLISMRAESRARGLNIALNLASGFMVMCVLFLIPAVPMIILHAPFHVLKYTWIVLMAGACVSSVILSVRRVTAGKGKEADKTEEPAASKKKFDVFTVCIWIAAIVIIIFETGLLVTRMHTDTDDARFIVDAMEALSRDTMLEYNPITNIHHGIPVGEQVKDVSAPYPIFIALVSSITGLHPAIMAHTVMPLLYIPLSYLVFSLIGGVIFKDDLKKRGLFLFLLSLIHLFSFETIFSAGYTLLTIIWQGRSVAAVIMLPFLWYLLLDMADKEKVTAGDYALICAAALANAMLSNMGSLFAFILCMAYALSFSLQDKKLKPLIYMFAAMIPDLAVVVLGRLLYAGVLYR